MPSLSHDRIPVPPAKASRGVWILLLAALVQGCHPPPPTPVPLLGCYQVTVTGWSAQFQEATGLESLPTVIAITPHVDRYLAVPVAWRDQPPQYRNRAGWTDRLPDWRRYPDGVRLDPLAVPHQLQGDSLVVWWGGWRGAATAYLAPTGRGLEGTLQLSSWWGQAVPPGSVVLRAARCSGPLVSSAPAVVD